MCVCSLLDQKRENHRYGNPQKKNFLKKLLFFGHIEIPKDIVNQIPGPGYNRKFKKVRTQFFFTSILESLLVTFISQDFGHFLVRFLEYLANARAKIRNFRKSSNLKSRYLQNYLDFFKSFWCFGKPMDRSFQLSELERLARHFFKFLGGVDLGIFRKFTFPAP